MEFTVFTFYLELVLQVSLDVLDLRVFIGGVDQNVIDIGLPLVPLQDVYQIICTLAKKSPV